METYRDMLYRYSTGYGPSLTYSLPKNQTEWASFKLQPLKAMLALPLMDTDLKREADRLSMQVESASRIIITFGSNSYAENCYVNLKNQLELIKYLLLNRGVRYITNQDLERLHRLFAKDKSKIDAAVDVLIKKYQEFPTPYPEHPYHAHPGYLLYDEFGRAKPAGPTKGPLAFDGLDLSDKKPWLAVAALAAAFFYFKKKKGK